MYLKVFAFGIATLLLCACNNQEKVFHIPAAWEHQDAMWLGWEADTSYGYQSVLVSIIKAISHKVQINLAVDSDSLKLQASHYFKSKGINPDLIHFQIIKGSQFWIRDFGAQFLVNDLGELAIVDFIFNGYGYPDFLKRQFGENAQTKAILDAMELKVRETNKVSSLIALSQGASIIKTKIVQEGGGTEANGKGSLILCESTVMDRNPALSKRSIESEFKRLLGVTNIIWLKQGLLEDPLHCFRRIHQNYIACGTGGHTDSFVRFVDASTIFIAWIDESEIKGNPILQINHDRMKENYTILQNALDQDGRPFNIIKVPMPDLISKKLTARCFQQTNFDMEVISCQGFIPSEMPNEGETLFQVANASYLNFVITNGMILLPTYTHMGSSKSKEDLVRLIFKIEFPHSQIVFIDAMPLNWKGGGLHCLTMEQPGKSKYLP
ncbi:MAG: agmatine deiminase family protein [Saprospiraceae bacterium]|nr:agmatine deiminase family protein [Saprospiraceae bacterium]